ncbi:sulfotransferase 1A2-like [Liolophura sinensis]|uniref:sulfotransferase 1A2-like n=1 Tax=Liolophura sinensis TaxID=3198878 RepID=UPI003158B7E2
MPSIVAKDPRGNTINYHEFQGKRFPPVPIQIHDLDISLANLPDIPCRDDDVTIVTYPKAGTHWTWEIANMLLSNGTEVSKREKEESMIEVQPTEKINNLPSVRILNTHVTPDIFPKELVTKKAKIIYVTRNPKDIFVSYYYHVKKIKFYNYGGDWDSFFEHIMTGLVDFGDWFTFTKQWETFFQEHQDIPLLRLNYEQLKQDMGTGVDKIAKFLGVSCNETTRENIVQKCDFANMKQQKGVMSEHMKGMIEGDEHPMYRKGVIGDWKTHFTVAQSERFDEEYKKQMSGYSFDFEKYM